ncbi:putative serpin E3 [Collichthys lucidus]|uniref:Putative serpin E3 n=1 Tax=Collichthys lucidus TaxID=240159 RepID=A0A4V6AM98_COLLU|nr:putative serpin E3 [Collichthys lucidus]
MPPSAWLLIAPGLQESRTSECFSERRPEDRTRGTYRQPGTAEDRFSDKKQLTGTDRQDTAACRGWMVPVAVLENSWSQTDSTSPVRSTEDMRRLPVASLFICFWLVERSHSNGSLQDSMGELHNRFAVSLYQTLTETENSSNLIVSPVSVSLSLGLLQLGARGNTLAQLEGTLGYNVNNAQVQDFLLHSQSDISNTSQGVWLQQTCTLFIQNGVQLLTKFTQHAAAWANTSVVRANFSQPNHTRGQLERARNTHDETWHIQAGSSSGELSGSGEVQADALWWGHRLQMALVNTVAFRGVWQKQFLFTNTQNLPFILSDGTAIKVPMMYQATEFRTTSDQRYTVLELPYLGRSLSLQVVLPSERKTPLSCLESQLTARQLASWETGLRRTKMDIFLPRFKMQNKFNLRSVLPAMGISDAFNPTAADFTGISGHTVDLLAADSLFLPAVEESLYMSDAFHEVRIEVTEDGTKAAAATGSILFMGRVMNPADQAP